MKARPKRDDPLRLPAVAVVCNRAEKLVHGIDSAMARLADPAHDEALHEVRVSLRRLRVWLRAFESPLRIRPGQQRRLKRLTRRTTLARDTEVALAWSARLQPAKDGRTEDGGFDRGLRLLRDESYGRLRREFASAWPTLAAKLRRRVSSASARGDRTRFLEALAEALRPYARKLDAALENARRHPDTAHIHRLRIAGKNARYLIEVAGVRRPEATRLVRELVRLQDLAGRIHDLQRYMELSEEVFRRRALLRYRRLLQRYIDVGLDDRTLPKPGPEAAMVRLLSSCRRVARRQARETAAFRKKYLGRKRPDCALLMHRFIAQLGGPMTGG